MTLLIYLFIIATTINVYGRGVEARTTVLGEDNNPISNTIDEDTKRNDLGHVLVYNEPESNDNITIDTNTIDEETKSNLTAVDKENDNKPGISLDETEPCGNSDKVDNGTALLLTPYILDGRISEGVNASRVPPELFLGVESYSGFLTVNSTHKSHLFFWYFPSFTKPVNETPWIIWLQGGPGSSSMNGLFQEIGPFGVHSSGKLYENSYTWLRNHSLVFIDNPVGTGYSFTEHPEGYAKDMATYGSHLHTCVRQLVQLFPALRTAPLFVAGESYAGKYVPALAAEIHRHNHQLGLDLNLKGLIIGNGFIEPEMVTEAYKVYYQFGLVEKYQMDHLQIFIEALQADVINKNSSAAYDKYVKLGWRLTYLSGVYRHEMYNYLRKEPLFTGYYTKFLNQTAVKRALHVGDREFFSLSSVVREHLIPDDFLTTTRPLIEDLLEHYQVLAYCGSLDLMIPCVVSSERIRSWKWSGRQAFLDASRDAFYFNRTRAGFVTRGGGLTRAVFVGVGHMVPGEAPALTQRFIARYTHHMPLAISL